MKRAWRLDSKEASHGSAHQAPATGICKSGMITQGATFACGGSTYVVKGYKSVSLKSYGSSSKAPTVNTVKYGGVTYGVNGIAAKAFTTKKGRAITSLKLGSNVRSVGANAFAGTSKLGKLDVRKFPYYSAGLSRKAFSKCGRSNGAGLTVRCQYDWEAKTVRDALVKAGLSKKAKVVA